MCEYCENKKNINSTDDKVGLNVVTRLTNGIPSLLFTKILDTAQIILEVFPINFCPMCGRDLRKENGK